MGIVTFAFGMGESLANFAGLLHMALHSLTKSAIFYAVGLIAQAKGTQRIDEINGLTSSHPALGWGFVAAVLAISGLPPFGLFMSEFVLVTSTFPRQPSLGVVLLAGLVIAFGAMAFRLHALAFGEPTGPSMPVKASLIPLFLHLALILAAGIFLPQALVDWFMNVAHFLG
jgi:hydrogenase-4 component F